jgi:3-isopropylmalate/(R)-2-methylmalate dehydratase small subunit
MKSFTRHTGLVVPFPHVNVDTDQIVPKQFLKSVERTGFGDVLFHNWRYSEHGKPNPTFVLNLERFRPASILVAGQNFGSGSSREHAVWALQDFGFQVIIAPSFADIFANNCAKNGLLVVTLPLDVVECINEKALSRVGYHLTVDLESCVVSDSEGLHENFVITDHTRRLLLLGLDDIALTLAHVAQIDTYERQRC